MRTQPQQHNPNKIVRTRTAGPLILSGSHADREARARTLVTLFVKFLSDHVDLIVQVRQDFLAKSKTETIMGCHTFGEYCRNILHYSESHIRRLIAGRNPATAIFDGSKNRTPALLEDSRTNVQRLHDSGFVERCKKYDCTLLGLVLAQAIALDEMEKAASPSEQWNFLEQAAILEGQIEHHHLNRYLQKQGLETA